MFYDTSCFPFVEELESEWETILSEYLNIKNEEEIFIEKFYYMNDNFDPNKPPKKSPPISKSFKQFYLNNVASKVLIN